ncbi:MAG: DUF4124 domain-containing protein [Proteobacteria bacterium]|nr:MAG: DUF4124 domain-containing protein [Pseudomonadota bacterium]
MKILTLMTVLLMSNAVIAKQKYYKWTDENGSIHYSTEKPENDKTDELEISTKQPVVPQKPQEAQPEGSENPEETEEKSYLEQHREKKQQAKKLAEENRERCLDAKHTVNRYQQQVRMSRIDRETGEKIYLDDAKREQIIQRAQQAVRKYCH